MTPPTKHDKKAYVARAPSPASFAQAGTASTNLTLSIKLHPRARKNAITGELNGALKLSLTAPPIDGKANQACIDFFAKLLNLPRSSVTIASGHASRNKVIRIVGLSAEELRRRIGT